MAIIINTGVIQSHPNHVLVFSLFVFSEEYSETHPLPPHVGHGFGPKLVCTKPEPEH
jgi:hypothetical protein